MNKLAESIKAYRESKGFETSWENMPMKLMLVVTEASEAMEAWRKGDHANFNEEIADVIIRCLDITASLGIDIEKEIKDKMEHNQNRPYKHGKIA